MTQGSDWFHFIRQKHNERKQNTTRFYVVLTAFYKHLSHKTNCFNTRGLRKYNAAETLVGLAGTHRYSCVQVCAIDQPSVKISFKKFQWLDRLASIIDLSKYIKSTCYKYIQYSRISFTLMLRIVHLEGNRKLSVKGVF